MCRIRTFALCATTLLSVGCSEQKPRTLTIFAAASMGPALDAIRPVFEGRHPGTRLQVELSGSKLAVAKVSDQRREADVVLSADFELIDHLLVPEHASFNVLFGSNALVLAYSPLSPVAAAFERGEPWQTVLTQPGVSVGIANPTMAPVGYRALLALQLNDLFADAPLRLGAQITSAIKREHQRPDVAKLVAPVQAGELDAAFVYRSEALQHGLKFVALDPRIDFSRIEHQADYKRATVTIPGEGGAAAQTYTGGASVYGLTIPKNAQHPELALELVKLLLSDEGRTLASKAHMDMYTPVERSVRGEAPPGIASVAGQSGTTSVQ